MVGRTLAQALIRAGESVRLELVDRACLLHDTVRVTEWENLTFEHFPSPPTAEDIAVWEHQRRQFPPSVPHAQVNYELFADQYPEVARLILLHSISSAPHVRTWEEKLVNYADRRVAHDRIVSVQERLEEGFNRYSKTSQTPLERDPAIVAAILGIEKEIFDRIGEDPGALQKMSEQ